MRLILSRVERFLWKGNNVGVEPAVWVDDAEYWAAIRFLMGEGGGEAIAPRRLRQLRTYRRVLADPIVFSEMEARRLLGLLSWGRVISPPPPPR